MAAEFNRESGSSDTELLSAYALGDHSAARELTFRLTPRVLALARRMLADASEAEDVAQEAMLRLWKAAPDWEDQGAAPATWLYRVASNLCIDRLRRRRENTMDVLPEIADEAPSVAALLHARSRAEALSAALLDLPERQRLAVILRHLEERSNPEIAEIMETSIEAVESLLSRGRRLLAKALAGRQDELGLVDENP